MSEPADDKQPLIGRCFCGELFIASKQSEYKSIVSRHIIDHHREQPPDKPLVKLVQGDIDD